MRCKAIFFAVWIYGVQIETKHNDLNPFKLSQSIQSLSGHLLYCAKLRHNSDIYPSEDELGKTTSLQRGKKEDEWAKVQEWVKRDSGKLWEVGDLAKFILQGIKSSFKIMVYARHPQKHNPVSLLVNKSPITVLLIGPGNSTREGLLVKEILEKVQI